MAHEPGQRVFDPGRCPTRRSWDYDTAIDVLRAGKVGAETLITHALAAAGTDIVAAARGSCPPAARSRNAVFLASPAADYIRGAAIAVDGGWLGR